MEQLERRHKEIERHLRRLQSKPKPDKKELEKTLSKFNSLNEVLQQRRSTK